MAITEAERKRLQRQRAQGERLGLVSLPGGHAPRPGALPMSGPPGKRGPKTYPGNLTREDLIGLLESQATDGERSADRIKAIALLLSIAPSREDIADVETLTTEDLQALVALGKRSA